jgi:hypothetical protein
MKRSSRASRATKGEETKREAGEKRNKHSGEKERSEL